MNISVPDKVKKEVQESLRDLQKPSKLDKSPLGSSCIVAKYHQENLEATKALALKEVLTKILSLLEKEAPDHADILKGRFWEGHKLTKMIVDQRPKAWAERTFYDRQAEALQRFTELFWEQEQACQRSLQPSVEILVPLSQKGHFSLIKDWQYRHKWVTLVVFIAIVLIGSVALIRSASVSTNEVHTCGEGSRLVVSAPSLLRSQGITNFAVENMNGAVLNNKVRAVTIGPSGLWVGYFATEQNPKNGVGHYNKSSWADCNQAEGIVTGDVNALAVDKVGRVWVATEKNGVEMFDGEKWQTFTTQQGLPSNQTYGLTVDEDNTVWVATWEGVAKFNGSIWEDFYTVNSGTIFYNDVHAIAFDQEKNVWVGHIDNGVSQFRAKDGEWIHHTVESGGVGGNKVRGIVIRKATTGAPESVWFATADGGVSRFEQGKWTVYRVEDGLPNNHVRGIAVDKYNRVWAATAGGVAYFDGQHWITYDTIDTFSIAFGLSCQDCPIDDDHVWTGTFAQGLTHSRLPYPDEALDVIKICFEPVKEERGEPLCPALTEIDYPPTIITIYPKPVKPGEKIYFEIVVRPRGSYQLREEKGDFLSNIEDDEAKLFGVYPIIAIKGIVDKGRSFTFTDRNKPFIAPSLAGDEAEKVVTSTWRVWTYTRYAGPFIQLQFKIRKP